MIPGLLDIVRSAPEAGDSAAPSLARLLALSRLPKVDAKEDPAAIACRALGIAHQRDWPVAPWLARGAGLPAAGAYWLCADPVNLVIRRDDVRLNRVVSDILTDETSVLISTLNAHFAADGVRFHAPHPARWLVETDEPQAIATFSTEAALGEPMLDYLPHGPAAATWRRWQSEIQMLLFEHPVNRAREAAGLDVVNSVWLWGGGLSDAGTARPSVDTVYADVAWLTELAAAAGVAALPAPASFDALGASASASAIVWLDSMHADDLPAALAALDRAWGQPLHDALRRDAIGALHIVATGRSRTMSFAPQRPTSATRWKTAFSAPRLSALLRDAADR